MHCFVSFLVLNILMRKSFALFAFLVSSDCYVALSYSAVGCTAMPPCVIVLFPDHTHLLFPFLVTGKIDIR